MQCGPIRPTRCWASGPGLPRTAAAARHIVAEFPQSVTCASCTKAGKPLWKNCTFPPDSTIGTQKRFPTNSLSGNSGMKDGWLAATGEALGPFPRFGPRSAKTPKSSPPMAARDHGQKLAPPFWEKKASQQNRGLPLPKGRGAPPAGPARNRNLFRKK